MRSPSTTGRCARRITGNEWSGWEGITHSGTIVGDALVLGEGDRIIYSTSGRTLDFGATYADIEFSGQLVGTGPFPQTHTQADSRLLRLSALVNAAPAYHWTAGPGGAVVRSITLATAKF